MGASLKLTTDPDDGRIDHCPSCKLRLPLRIPWPGEVGSSWVCTHCGGRSFAVLDDRCPPDILAHVRPASAIKPGLMIRGETLVTMRTHSGRNRHVPPDQRQPFVHDIAFTVGDHRMDATTLDLSAGGFSFLTDQHLTKGAELTVEFLGPPRAPAIRCVVRDCTSSDDGHYRIGVAIVAIKV